MTTIGQWLVDHDDLPRADRDALLCQAAGLTRAQVLARPERPLEQAALDRLGGWTARRRRGEPVAYILGRQEFWGLELAVTSAVLIPRPETELLVEVGLELSSQQRPPVGAAEPRSAWRSQSERTAEPRSAWRSQSERTISRSRSRDGYPGNSRSGDRSYSDILELGTGSGAVAIALAREYPDANLTASDRSSDALAVAQANAARHDVEIHWVESDWYSSIDGEYDVILSNPPYLADGDPHLGSLAYEPRLALTAGADGLDAIRAIVSGAPARLRPGGWLALEHGWDQAEAVRRLLAAAGLGAVTTRRDLAGHERVSSGRLPGGPPCTAS